MIVYSVLLCFLRKEVDDYFQTSETGATKRNALSIFKIARKLLFIYCQEDKMVIWIFSEPDLEMNDIF